MRLLPRLPDVPPTPTLSAGGRDLALDVVRSWSLLVVVVGHVLMLIVVWSDEHVPATGNTLTSGEPWPFATWLFQVMPLCFVAGGAVNRRSHERFGGTYSQWLWRRVSRLMRPTVVFLAVLCVVFTVVTVLVPRAITDPYVQGVSGPLWFLSVYAGITALTPLTSAWWRRRGPESLVVLLAAVVVVDVLRLHVLDTLGAANLVVVWALAHQLGYWYQDGVRRGVAIGFVAVGLTAEVVLTQVLQWYPTSLVGLPTERFSNIAPPTVVLAAHAAVLFGLFALLAPWLRRRFATPRLRTATLHAGLLAMTVYLWHELVLVGWLGLLHVLGLDLPVRVEGGLIVPDGPAYWARLVPVAGVYLVLVWVVGRLLWPVELARLPWFDDPPRRPPRPWWVAAVGAVVLCGGLLAVAGAGFSGFPLATAVTFGVTVSTAVALLAVVAGLVLLREPLPARAPSS